MKTYNVASPYFSNAEKKRILEGTQKVLDGRLSTGPYTKEFEKKFARFIGCKFAVFLNSCTSALEIAVKSLNLNPSDEVIVPCETFIATGMAVTSQGAKVVFANINSNTFCIDLDEIKKKCTKNTKALMLVHFGGYMPKDLKLIIQYCKRKNIKIIEDCAHALGSKFGKYTAGNIGIAGCFSFFSTKTITTGEGGMLTTNDRSIYKLALSLRERGRDWEKEGEQYAIGWRTCRVPEISAVIGINQFSNIKKIISHRMKISKIYNKEISKTGFLTALPIYKKAKLSIWKHITLIKNNKIKRQNLAKKLKDNHKIFINWAYDPPLHLQPVYKKYLKGRKKFRSSENILSRHFHLPLHMQISEQDAKFVIKKVIEECNNILRSE
tara:strand:+ start:5603 stop:6745 length:1143 start_codon:yes stop_codon:yes gene_type:complete